jgi:hypothetical protein
MTLNHFSVIDGVAKTKDLDLRITDVKVQRNFLILKAAIEELATQIVELDARITELEP